MTDLITLNELFGTITLLEDNPSLAVWLTVLTLSGIIMYCVMDAEREKENKKKFDQIAKEIEEIKKRLAELGK